MDLLKAHEDIDSLIKSLSRFSEKALLVLTGKSNIQALAKKIGPTLIFERLWKELQIGKVIRSCQLSKDWPIG